MARLVGCVAGTWMCLDGLLGTLALSQWAQLWRGVASLLPGPTGAYFQEVIQVTEKHQRVAPGAMRTMFLLELGMGLAILLALSRSSDEPSAGASLEDEVVT